MKKSVLFVCFALTLIVVGCTATKESNVPSDQELAQSEELMEKSAKLEKLEAELTASKASLRAIESQLSSIQIENDDLASQLEVYEGSIGNVKSNFLKLQDQLKKIKARLQWRFQIT